MNLIRSKGTYYKQETVERHIRKILAENQDGISSEDFVKSVRDATNVSRGMVFSAIKHFQSVGLMKIERNSTDRRKVKYIPNLQKVRTEQGLSEGIEFIRSLGPDVKFAEAEAKAQGFRIRASVYTNQRDCMKQGLEDEAKATANNTLFFLKSEVEMHHIKIPPSYKKATILTLETTRGVKP